MQCQQISYKCHQYHDLEPGCMVVFSDHNLSQCICFIPMSGVHVYHLNGYISVASMSIHQCLEKVDAV